MTTSIHLYTFKYVLASPLHGEGGISILERARDRFRKRYEEAKSLASKDPTSPLILKTLEHYSRAFKAYDLLISQLQDKMELLPQVLGLVSHTKHIRTLIPKLEGLGFKLDTHLPGEGMYQGPAVREKTVPITQPVPSRNL